MKFKLAIGLLVFVLLALSEREQRHHREPHTVVHRDGRVWFLECSPMGHRMNGALRFDNKITFLDYDGFIVSYPRSDVKVYCTDGVSP